MNISEFFNDLNDGQRIALAFAVLFGALSLYQIVRALMKNSLRTHGGTIGAGFGPAFRLVFAFFFAVLAVAAIWFGVL